MEKYILDSQYKKYLERAGIQVDKALKDSGLPEDLFIQKKPTLGEVDYYRFMEEIGLQIIDPQLTIQIGSSNTIETISPPVFAAYCAPNAKICCERLSRYKRLIAPMRYETHCDQNVFTLEIAASNDTLTIPQFLIVSEIVFFLHLIRTAAQIKIKPVSIGMVDPPITDNLAQYAGCPIQKKAKNILLFRLEDMEIPFISHNENMWQFMAPELQKRLSQIESNDSFSAKVQRTITELLPYAEVTVDQVASKLGTSKRTLQRKLFKEGTTFQKQLNDTRQLLAKHYLLTTDMSGDEIAFLLGYQELNSFLRAFNLWTGMSLSQYRKTQK